MESRRATRHSSAARTRPRRSTTWQHLKDDDTSDSRSESPVEEEFNLPPRTRKRHAAAEVSSSKKQRRGPQKFKEVKSQSQSEERASEPPASSGTTEEWVNTGETKEDDDRVVLEVMKRHAVAKEIFSAPISTSKTPLEQLLDKSNQYTAYMLAQSLAPHEAVKGGGRKDRRVVPEDEESLLLEEADAELTGQQRFWTRLETQPKTIEGGTLKSYQLEGLNWLIYLYESGLNGILADEMGLGKTLQTIALLSYLKESRNISGPHLILAPKSTLGNWLNEIHRFSPTLKAYKFHGNKEQREEAKKTELIPSLGLHDIIITSYELCIREQQLFKKFRFRYIVVDEAHRIKNEASKLSQIIRQFKTEFRLLLTGTPLQVINFNFIIFYQNNLRELWALLNFLFPEMFHSAEEFDRLFDLTGTSDEVKNLSADEMSARNSEIVTRLHKILKPFLLRRVKSEVMFDLPPKKELLLYIPLSSLQRTLYKNLLSHNVDAMHDLHGGGKLRLLNLAMQLRKACNHPYLFDGYEDKSADAFGEHLVTNSGKMLLLDRLLQRLISSGSRTLIFTQMTRMMDILEDYCRLREFSYCRLDGSTIGEERERQLEEFNAPGSLHSVFLLSTRAGGLGINLATADTVILFDSDWNPQVDLQAMDRAHRIGQKKPVNVYRFVHQHTIEEKIIERASLKLKLDSAVIQQGRLSDQQKQLGKGELLRMIQFGADRIFKSKEAAEMTEEDVEAILSRGEQRCQELSVRMETHLKKTLLNFNTSFSTPSLYEFEGVDYEPQKDRQAWAEAGVTALEEERNAKRRVRVVQEQLEALQRQQMGLAATANSDNKQRNNKLLKLPRMEEWQFYRRSRINKLHELEVQYVNGLGDEPTFEEREEKQQLLSEGFGEWGRKDFVAFVKSCETSGMNNIAQLSKDVGKSISEVERYCAVFLERYNELAEGEKWLARVKHGEEVNAKRGEVNEILSKKLAEERYPWKRLFVKFPKSKTHYTDDEDSWLLNAVHSIGYGNWDELHMAINRDITWTFNWFLRTRSAQDIGRRVEFLVRQLQREQEETTALPTSSTRSKSRTAIAMQEYKGLFPTPDVMYGLTAQPQISTSPQQRRAKKQRRKIEVTPQRIKQLKQEDEPITTINDVTTERIDQTTKEKSEETTIMTEELCASSPSNSVAQPQAHFVPWSVTSVFGSRPSNSTALTTKEPVPPVMVTFGNPPNSMTFISHPEMKYLVSSRARLTQNNVDAIKEFDSNLAQKCQLAVDANIDINFLEIEHIDKPEFLQKFLREKEILQAARSEVLGSRDDGTYRIPYTAKLWSKPEVPRKWRPDANITAEILSLEPDLIKDIELQQIVNDYLKKKPEKKSDDPIFAAD